MHKKIFAVLGGDGRQVYVARLLREHGFEIRTSYLPDNEFINEKCSDALRNADYVLLPLPYSLDGKTIFAPASSDPVMLDGIISLIPKSAVIFAGRTDGRQLGGITYDYSAQEEFMLMNAVPSAEGAIQRAMENTDITLNSSVCVVIGAGRIGSVLAKDLAALGADVTLTARKTSDLIKAGSFGIKTCRTSELSSVTDNADLIFNTVPARVIDGDIISRMKKTAVIIDLASNGGGTDFDAAQRYGIKAVYAPGLPGKTAPYSAALAVMNTVIELIGRMKKEIR